MKNRIIYQLTVEDIQTVAEEQLERAVTVEEIKEIESLVAEKINWYDAIADAIQQVMIKKESPSQS